MKIVQTFWTGPSAASGNVLDIKAGWKSAGFHWMSWALSCLQLHKLYGQVELVTDERGKEILIDMLGLPYTSVSTMLEGKLNGYAPELWSLAKIVTFAAQEEPFLHFDGDFFMWQPVEERIKGAGLVAQNLEENLSYYRDMMQDMEKKGWRMPPVLAGVSQAPIIYAANTGIFGGHQLDFVKDYCQNAFDFINTNADIIPKTQKNQLNFIFEQCLLFYMAEQQGIAIEYLMEDPVYEPSYSDYARFVDVPHVKMIHTLGGYKTMPFTCSSMAKRLRNDFPEQYYRIVALCGGFGASDTIYRSAPFNEANFYPKLYKHGIEQYLSGGLKPTQQDPGPLLSAARGTAFETAFARSLQIARWLTQPVAGTNGNGEQPVKMAEDFGGLQQQLQGIVDEDERTATKEIFDMETTLFLLTDQLNDPIFLQQHYFKELLHYHKVAQLFAQPEQAILLATVLADESVAVLECSRDWNFSPEGATLDFVKEVISEVEGGMQVVLKIDVENKAIAELYPDTIDMVILDICKNKVSLADIVEQMKAYFDAEEIESGYQVYQRLILDTVKQLLFNGLLQLQ